MSVRRFTSSVFVRLYVSAASLMIGGLLYRPDPVLSAKPSCPAGQFRDVASARCVPCSSCPINHIVRRPCRGQNDTVCGPFYEFEYFHQSRNGTASYSLGTYLSKLGYRSSDGYIPSADDSIASAATTSRPTEGQ